MAEFKEFDQALLEGLSMCQQVVQQYLAYLQGMKPEELFPKFTHLRTNEVGFLDNKKHRWFMKLALVDEKMYKFPLEKFGAGKIVKDTIAKIINNLHPAVQWVLHNDLDPTIKLPRPELFENARIAVTPLTSAFLFNEKHGREMHDVFEKRIAFVWTVEGSPCNGQGECWILESETWVRQYNCDCELVKCPNYDLCQTRLPAELIKCYNGRCLNCDMTFGKNLVVTSRVHYDECFTLTHQTKESECHCHDCPVCLIDNWTYIVTLPCTHRVCVDCVKKIYWPMQADQVESYSVKCPLCRAEPDPEWLKNLSISSETPETS